MTKKHFIALADALRASKPTLQNYLPGMEIDAANRQWSTSVAFLSDTLVQDNPRFDRWKWLGYVAGTHTANGKEIKK